MHHFRVIRHSATDPKATEKKEETPTTTTKKYNKFIAEYTTKTTITTIMHTFVANRVSCMTSSVRKLQEKAFLLFKNKNNNNSNSNNKKSVVQSIMQTNK